jgi:hypothetical protein
LFLLGGLALTANVFAETNLTLTVDGVVYSNVTFGTLTPSWVSVRHATGATTIPLAKLPPDLQKQFGYDPDKAAQWQAAQQKAEAERAALKKKLATAQHWSLVVEEIGPNSIVVTGRQLRPPRPDLSKLPAGGPVGGSAGDAGIIARDYNNPFQTEEIEIVLVGYPKRNELADGNQFTAWAYKDGVVKVGGDTLEKWVYCEPPPGKK